MSAPSKLVSLYLGLCKVVKVRGPVLTLHELDSQRIFTANHDAICHSSLRPPHRAFVDGALSAPRNPHQVARAALPSVLIANRPTILSDASPPAHYDTIPHQQITESQPLRIAPSPPSKIADSENSVCR